MATSQKTPRKKRRTLTVLIILIVILIAVRIALPYIVLNYANKVLSKSKEYYGHLNDVDIALIRGAYVAKGLKIQKINSEGKQHDTIPFFTSPEIDISVEWKALLKKSLVAEIYVENPVLNFVKGKHKDEDPKADTADFRKMIKDLVPLKINHFEINNGQMHYIDNNRNPPIDVALNDIHIIATNLTNANDSNKLLPSSVFATANAYEGNMEFNMKLDALNEVPTFDMNTRISNVNMVLLNRFFKAYGNFELNKGNFGLYTEFAARDRKFKGYVKPIIKDIDVQQEGTIREVLWGTLLEGITDIFKNHPKDQVATKVPIEGSFDNPDTDIWEAISYVLRNAFVNALKPSIDNTINIGNVETPEPEKKTLLQKIFGKKKKENSNNTDSKDKENKDKDKSKGEGVSPNKKK